jgi:hypothetical protein
MSAQQDFASKVRELIRAARAFGPDVRKRVIELLEEARKRVIAEVADLDPASFTSVQLQAMRAEIDRALETFRMELTRSVNASQADAFASGEAIVGQPLAAVGMPAPSFFGFSRDALAIAQAYTADLIGGLSKDAAAKINAAIQRSFLGGQPVTETIQQIGKALANGQGFSGLFSPIGERAETIALNEILRVHSIAAQARLEDAAAVNPEIKKQWTHVPIARIPRFSHIQADGQVREVGEPFDVGGEDLMFPRDPGGSPENTINCHCLLRPYLDEAALKPTARQEKMLKDLGVNVSAA